MRSSRRCVKCECQKLYVVDRVSQPNHEASNGIYPLSITCSELGADVTGIEAGNRWRSPAGFFEAWICSHCGFTEWYARDPEGALEKLSGLAGSGVRVVSSPPVDPYRGR